MKSGARILAAGAVAVGLAVPATANATVAATVTGDGGTAVALTPGQPLGIRNMDVKAAAHVDATDAAAFTVTVAGPDGIAAARPSPCWNSKYTTDDSRSVDYRGNGNYTLSIALYNDANCTALKTTQAYVWSVGAGVAITPPAGTLMLRAANSYTTNTQVFGFTGNPGALGYEIKFAKGGALLPDGSISSPALQDAYLDSATGQVQVSAREPGDYVMVARAKSFTSGYLSPWSPPVNFKVIAPFDITSRSFPDSRGPSYQVRATVRETSAAGSKVTISVANGKKGKKFRTLGKAKVNSKGVFKLRFRIKKLGWYRLRYSFRGNSTVARGTVYESIRIRRVLR